MSNQKYDDPFKIPVSAVEKENVEKTTTKEDENDLPSTKSLNIRLSPALHKSFKKYCIEKGETIQDYVVSLIKKEIKKSK